MMKIIQAVRHDHTVLRNKLALVESALYLAPDARFVLREICFSLQQLLQDHLDREVGLLRTYAQLALTHHDPLEVDVEDHGYVLNLLRTVNDLLLTGARASMPTLNLWLSNVIDLLRRQMDVQEAVAFPLLEAGRGVRAGSRAGRAQVTEPWPRSATTPPVGAADLSN